MAHILNKTTTTPTMASDMINDAMRRLMTRARTSVTRSSSLHVPDLGKKRGASHRVKARSQRTHAATCWTTSRCPSASV